MNVIKFSFSILMYRWSKSFKLLSFLPKKLTNSLSSFVNVPFSYNYSSSNKLKEFTFNSRYSSQSSYTRSPSQEKVPKTEQSSNKNITEFDKVAKKLESWSSKDPTKAEVSDFLQILSHLAMAQQGQLEAPDVLKLYSEGLLIAHKYGITEGIELAYIYKGIGAINLFQENFTEAEAFLNSAEKIFEACLNEKDSKHPLLQNMSLKAALYNKQNKIEEAEKIFKTILPKIKTISDTKIASSLLILAYDGLGNIHYQKKELPEAIEYWKSGLELAVEESGNESLEAKGFYEMLAKAYYDAGKFSEALEYAEKYLTASLIHFGEDSLPVSASLYLVGQLHYKKGNYEEAIDKYHKVLHILEKYPDKTYSQMIDTHMLIAKAYFYKKDFQKANEAFNTAVELCFQVHEDHSVKLADCYTVWAELLRFKGGKMSEAKAFYTKALDIYRKLDNLKCPNVIDIYAYIGEICSQEEKLNESLEWFEKCLKVSLEIDNPERLEEVYGFMGAIYLKKQDYKKAIEFYEKALDACLALSNSSKKLHFHYHNLGTVYKKEGMIQEAADIYKKALDFDRAEYGNDDPKTQKTLNLVLQTLSELDEKDGTKK